MKSKDDHINQLTDDVQRLLARVRELEGQLADAVNGKLPDRERLDPSCLWVESIVATREQDGQLQTIPRINIRWFTHWAQLNEADARQLAFNILEACEAGLSDSFIASFARTVLGADDNIVGGMVYEFREHREKCKKQ
jgi:hypothetical protein